LNKEEEKMKKILGISLALMMVFALLTGCAATRRQPNRPQRKKLL
jgi:hypothetical protein